MPIPRQSATRTRHGVSQLAVASVCLLASAHAASATIYMRQVGSRLYLSGSFENGDEDRFAEFLTASKAQPVKVVFLDSFGGQIGAGIKLGQMIRKARLSTAVDANAARCDSACTLIFAGGIKRYYINAAAVFEGFSSRGGLGYHPAHWRDGSWTQGGLSDKGTALMSNYYRQMGQPGATLLMQKAGWNSIYRPSGATALKLKIATSLDMPPD